MNQEVCRTKKDSLDREQLSSTSIVIPVFNERGNVSDIQREIVSVMESLNVPYEIIWVDDGSDDGTDVVLRGLLDSSLGHSHLGLTRLAKLRHRSGQSTALWIGLNVARFPIIVTLDGDGQYDPRDLPRLLAELPGADLVIGERRQRCDGWSKRAFSLIANRVRRVITRSSLSDSGCAFRVFRRRDLRYCLPIRGLHRFLPSMFEGARLHVVSIPITHRVRPSGTSKYGIFSRVFTPFIDCLAIRWLSLRWITSHPNVHYEEVSRSVETPIA
jgi:dolichol-phosphate mannosyltransferase